MNVYADHAATTPMRACAKEAMLEALEDFGNPSSIHSAGRLAAVRLESARKEVAELLNCRPSEIYFTSGGTEADNWAIRAARYGDGHVVASAFEHHAIIHALEAMAREKERHVELVKPERDGIVDPERVRRNVSQYTNLVTVMAANNEVGTIQPVEEIGREIRKGGNKRTIFHTDAVQAVGHIPVDVQKMGVDMLSLSAHKFGGPKGVGVLYCRNGIILDPLLFGGGQERGNRPGTENTPGIVAMAVAMREACENMESAAAKTRELRDRLIRRIKEIPDSYIHGSLEKRLPGNVNCSFAGVEGEAVVIMLDLAGVCASSGSACTSGTGEPSHVLTAMGLSRKDAYGAIRITLAETNTEAEVDYIGDQLAEIVRKLRGQHRGRYRDRSRHRQNGADLPGQGWEHHGAIDGQVGRGPRRRIGGNLANGPGEDGTERAGGGVRGLGRGRIPPPGGGTDPPKPADQHTKPGGHDQGRSKGRGGHLHLLPGL